MRPTTGPQRRGQSARLSPRYSLASRLSTPRRSRRKTPTWIAPVSTMGTSMPAIEVLVRQVPALTSSAAEPNPGLLDFIVDGINVTARLGRGAAVALLTELCGGGGAISRGKSDPFTAPVYLEGEGRGNGLEADRPAMLLRGDRTAP